MDTTVQPTTLSAMFGTYPKTAPLKQQQVESPLLRLDIAPVDTAQKAFKDVVRGLKYDVAELAVITFLLAYDAGKPYRLLPFVMNGQFHHKSLVGRSDSGLAPADLAGKRVAMRSYSQTTPTWVRGILSDQYGVDLRSVRWLSQEGAHVAEYRDPPWVERIDSSASLEQMLRAGEVDAIIAGSGLSGEPGIAPMIANPQQAAQDWHRRTNAVPINHMVAVRSEVARERPDLVREVFRLLGDSRRVAGAEPAAGSGVDLQPAGFDAVATSLEIAIRYAHEQGLISRRFSADELYGDVADALA